MYKEEFKKIKLYSFDDILEKADYLVLTQGHRQFKENLEKIKKKNIYDCIGIIDKRSD